jgi:hypothetical protein
MSYTACIEGGRTACRRRECDGTGSGRVGARSVLVLRDRDARTHTHTYTASRKASHLRLLCVLPADAVDDDAVRA